MLTRLSKITANPDHSNVMEEILIKLRPGIAEAEGNDDIRMFYDTDNPDTFFIYERWQDHVYMDSHYRKAKYVRAFAGAPADLLEKPIESLDLCETEPFPEHGLKQPQPDDAPLTIFFIFKIKPETRPALLERFKIHIGHTRQEPGNLIFNLFTIEDDDETLVVYESWRNPSAVWNVHIHQPYTEETGILIERAVVGDIRQYMYFVANLVVADQAVTELA